MRWRAPRSPVFLALVLAAGLCGCGVTRSTLRLPAMQPGAARMGAWSENDVEAWLARHGHGPLGRHASLLADGEWTADGSRNLALRRWSEWWEGRMGAEELARRRRILSVGLGLD